MDTSSGRTPRISYADPTVIRAGQATAYRWGDETSGFVEDEVLVSSQLLHSIVFKLRPGTGFQHSHANPTIFRADVVYTVLAGAILVIDPEQGQVVRVQQGESVFFRRDTWHDGLNQGAAEARVLEFFSPPPATGSSSAYARQQPFLKNARYADDSVIGHWPGQAGTPEEGPRLQLVRPQQRPLRLEGDLLLGLIASTEFLTAAVGEIPGGGQSPARRYGGEACMVVTSGELSVHTELRGDAAQHQLGSGDTFIAPAGTSVSYHNQADGPTEFVLGVAPSYLDPGVGG